MLGRRKRFQQRTQLGILSPDRLCRKLALAGGHSRRRPNVITDKNRFQRHRRLRALVAHELGIESRDDFRGGRRFVCEIVRVPEQLVGDEYPGL